MKTKSRIVERTTVNGKKSYVIQIKVLFWWFDAGHPLISSAGISGTFNSLDQAIENLHIFDDSHKDVVLYSNEKIPSKQISL